MLLYDQYQGLFNCLELFHGDETTVQELVKSLFRTVSMEMRRHVTCVSFFVLAVYLCMVLMIIYDMLLPSDGVEEQHACRVFVLKGKLGCNRPEKHVYACKQSACEATLHTIVTHTSTGI